jgi:hypothetical protein
MIIYAIAKSKELAIVLEDYGPGGISAYIDAKSRFLN